MQCYRSVLQWQHNHHSVLNILKSSIFSSKLSKINIHINKIYMINTWLTHIKNKNARCSKFTLPEQQNDGAACEVT